MSVQAFHLSDDEFHAPHQLRPDLRDRNPQVRPYARYNGVIACGVATTRCSPHEYRPARSQSADTLLYVATLHGWAPHVYGHQSKLRLQSMQLNLRY